MTEAKAAGNSRRSHGRWKVWRRLALIGMAVGLLAARATMAQDDGGSQPLPVGTTVDLSVATVGPIRDVAVADQTYVAIEDQGLWVLQADGKTIEKVSAPVESITALATDGATYYLSGQGLFAGRDGEWGTQLTGLISTLCVQTNPPLYLAGGTTAMWWSEDGQHWAAVTFPDVRVLHCAIAGTIAYAGTSNGLYRSTDSGRTWTEASAGLATRYIEAVTLDSDTVYAGTGGGGLYVSTDHASSWTQVKTNVLVVDDVSVTAGMISLVSEGTLQQSVDAGETWASQDAGGATTVAAVTLVNNARAQQ